MVRIHGTLTAVLDASGAALTKSYHRKPDGSVSKRQYPQTSEVVTHELPFVGFDGMCEALGAVIATGKAAVIRGVPSKWHLTDGRPGYRLAKPQPALVYAGTGKRVPQTTVERQGLEADGQHYLDATMLPTFREAAQHVLILDIDRIPVAPELGNTWVDEPERAVEHVVSLMPPALHEVSCFFSVSSSAAVPGAHGREVSPLYKLKLAFLLDRALTSSEVKRWFRAENAPIDTSVFSTIQLIYLAPPLITGAHDPVPRRTGIVRGLSDIVTVPELLPEPDYDEADAVEGFASCAGIDELVERLRLDLEGAEHCREYILTAVKGFCRHSPTPVDQRALTGALEALARQFRSKAEVAGYGIGRMVADYSRRAAARQAPCVSSSGTEPELDPPPPHYPAHELPACEASAKLRALIADAVANAVAYRDRSPFDFLDDDAPGPSKTGIKGAAGLGKTTAFLAAIAHQAGLRVDYLSPTIDLCSEVADDARAAGLSPQLIRGREAIVDGEPMCRKADEARILARAGLPVSEMLCRKKLPGQVEEFCEFFDSCRYVAQWRAPDHGQNHQPQLRLMAHEYAFLPRTKRLIAPEELPKPHLIVVDESFWQGAARSSSVGLDRLTATRTNMKVKDEADVRRAALLLRQALEEGRHPRELLTAEEIDKIAKVEGEAVWGLAPVCPGMAHAVQRKRLAVLKASDGSRMYRLWKVLADELRRPTPLQQIVLRRDVPDARTGELQDRVEFFWRRKIELPDVPVLLLDASLDPTIAGRFFPGLVVHDVPAMRCADVTQVRDSTCSMTGLLSYATADDASKAKAERRLGEVVGIAKAEARGGKKVALISYKAAVERIRERSGPTGTDQFPQNISEFPPCFDLLHLGGLRGLDRLKDHGTIIVAGRLQPTPAQVEGMARALFADDAEPLALLPPGANYPRVRRGYRMRDGSHASVAVAVHPDPRVQAVLEQCREREVEQAIDRARLVHRKIPGRVIVMGSTPLDLTVDRLVSWNDLQPDRWEQTLDALGGCLPLSPSELARLAPQIWGTANSAGQWLKRHGKGVHSVIESIYYALYPLSAATLVEYRRLGQRGSPHRAWVPGDLFCTEAARLRLADAGFGDVTVIAIIKVERREPTPAAEPWPLPEHAADVTAFPIAEPPEDIASMDAADWHERAAIAEFDGEVPRRLAERAATETLRRRKPEPPSLSDGGVWLPPRVSKPLLPPIRDLFAIGGRVMAPSFTPFAAAAA